MTVSSSAPHRFDLDAGSFTLSLAVADDGRLHQVGLGRSVDVPEDVPFPVSLYPLALPTFGEEVQREPALRITHADGATSTRMVFDSAEPRVTDPDPHDPIPGVPATRIRLRERVSPVTVDLWYRTWPDHSLLETWLSVTTAGEAPITVHDAASGAWSFGGSTPTFTHWGGGWAGEWNEVTEPLSRGVKTVASVGGVRSSLYLPPVALFAPDGPATESSGTVVACTVLWGGDTRFSAESALHGQQRLIAGPQCRGAERILHAGETFTTPHALWAWSDQGIGPTSDAFHRFTRDHLVRDAHRTRATVVNTWEAVGFSLDPDDLAEQARRGSEVGGELFLLDDGWFGTEFPRDDDTQGLGDWSTDLRKLPGGLQPVIDATLDTGMRFGLWVEPEMVNPRSELYRDHPDWVIAEPGRDRREERQQLVLDVTRSDVREHCVEVIDRVLREHPGISYLKWDANRDVTEPGSSTLSADRQSHLPVDRVQATWEIMAEVARRHPDVELMLCASGGGRSDLGTLRFFHELWTSDNTDPVDRVRIQWGASHLLPAQVLGAHVTRWGDRPLAFGCAVAMSGRFGFDLDLTALTDDEAAVCAQAAADYAAIRDLVQHGTLRRLVSPVGSDRAALAYVSTGTEAGVATQIAGQLDTATDTDPDTAPVTDTFARAVVFAYRLPPDPDAPPADADSGVELPPPPSGYRWEITDRTPGRVTSPVTAVGKPTRQAELVDIDRLRWPDESPGARIVELRAVPVGQR